MSPILNNNTELPTPPPGYVRTSQGKLIKLKQQQTSLNQAYMRARKKKRQRMRNKLSLHPGQFYVYKHPARFKVVVAGRRWGKTQCAKSILINAARKPNKLVWYVAPTYGMAQQIMWHEMLSSIPRQWIAKKNETRLTIYLVNGSVIALKGADNPDTMRGVGLSLVVVDEFQDMKVETWNKVLRPTLSTTGGSAVFLGTPKGFSHFYDLWAFGNKPENWFTESRGQRVANWKSFKFLTIDSPFVPDEEVEQARNDMDERSFRQEYEADFLNSGGAIYYAFDQDVHVTDQIGFNPAYPLWVGQDFNVNPMSSCIMQPQPNGEVHVIDEIFLINSNTAECVEELERRYWRHKSNTIIYPDASGAFGSTKVEAGKSDLSIFIDKGYNNIRHKRKNPNRRDRYNSMNTMLRSASGVVRMRIHPKCKHAIESLLMTEYKEGTNEVDKKADKEHMTDAMGYPISYEFPMGGVRLMGVSI